MTRVTNFGRKRTYLEANQDNAQTPVSQMQAMTPNPPADPEAAPARGPDEQASEPPKKKRKRAFSKKKSGQRDASESGTCVVESRFDLEAPFDVNGPKQYFIYLDVAAGAKRGKKLLDGRKKGVCVFLFPGHCCSSCSSFAYYNSDCI